MPTQGNWYYQDRYPALCLKDHRNSKNICGQVWYIDHMCPKPLTLELLMEFFEDNRGGFPPKPELVRQAILWFLRLLLRNYLKDRILVIDP